MVDDLLGPRALLKCLEQSPTTPLDNDVDHTLMCVNIPVSLKKWPVHSETSVRWRLSKFEDQAVAKDYRDLMSVEVVAATSSLGELSKDSAQSEIGDIATQITDIIVRVVSPSNGKILSRGRHADLWRTAEYNDIKMKSQ